MAKNTNTKNLLNAIDDSDMVTVNSGGKDFEPIVAYYQYTPSKTGSNLARVMEVNQTIKGIYDGSFVAGKFERTTHKIKTEEGIVALPSAGQLDKLLANVPAGATVAVTYRGKKEMESGKYAGRSAHNFLVRASRVTTAE